MKTIKPLIGLISMGLICIHSSSIAYAESDLPKGQLLCHSYSSYTAMDSKIHYYDLNTGEIFNITSSVFVNEMNADFGSHPYDIVFMAIDPAADEWDIYRYNTISRRFTNLTRNSGYRNEDPKFSPDGRSILFKRGYWSQEADRFIYDLAEMDLLTGEIRMLTDDVQEQAMPVYSPDGESVYYSVHLETGESGIYRISCTDPAFSQECLFHESGLSAYYPMTAGDDLYFTRWISADLPNDSIVKYTDGQLQALPFNNEDFNCSDPFPLADGTMFYSSTKNGSYDLYYYNRDASVELTPLSTGLNELGTSFYSRDEARTLIQNTADFLVEKTPSERNMDANGDGSVNVFDLVYFKQLIS